MGGAGIVSLVVGALAFDGISIETRGFLLMGTCFLISSAFWLGKTVRDAAEPKESPLHPKAKDWVLAVSSMLMAGGMVFGGLLAYTHAGVLPTNKATYFAMAFFFALF